MDRNSHTSREFRHYFVSKSWLMAISILVLGLSIAGFISALPRPNAAHAVPASTPILQVSPSAQSYFSNTKLRVQGSNYPSSAETVNVYWDYKNAGNPGTFVGTSVSSKGAFTVSFSIPASSTKYYTIAAVGQTSGTVATTTFHLLPNLYALPRAIGPGSKFTLTGQAFGANETVNIYSNCSSNCTGPTLAQGVTDGNYTGLLPTCQRRGNRLKYTYDERRRTASPSGRKSKPQSVGSGTAPVERAIGPGQCPDQGVGRPIGHQQSNQ